MADNTGPLPDISTELERRMTISEKQAERAYRVLAEMGLSLESLPLVLAQDGEVIAFAGPISEAHASRLARHADRAWREGAARLPPELIRFQEEMIDDTPERAAYLIYSAHIAGAVTLTVGWQPPISFTRVRAEVTAARADLMQILSG
ncbi:MAG: hypothetical protein Kow00124_07090 [Anaerolineae bacterium]